MTIRLTSRLLAAAAAAVTGALLLAPIPQAGAAGGTVIATRDHRGEARPIQRSADRPFVYGQGRVVRDHRKNPGPWSPPRHGTPH